MSSVVPSVVPSGGFLQLPQPTVTVKATLYHTKGRETLTTSSVRLFMIHMCVAEEGSI